jgi:hypothetical protein
MGFGGGFKSGGDLPGQILAYTQVTGALDGTGKHQLIGLKNGTHRTTTNWTVHQDGGVSPLGITFTMPASGRAEVSVPSGVRMAESASNYEEYWWQPTIPEVTAAKTAVGMESKTFSWNKVGVYSSLSTTTGSYTPAGPRNEMERLIRTSYNAASGASPRIKLNMGPWVMTGAAGSTHTVYLAFNGDAFSTYTANVGMLVYGGTGSTDPNIPDASGLGSPNAGPIILKVVSLPSA